MHHRSLAMLFAGLRLLRAHKWNRNGTSFCQQTSASVTSIYLISQRDHEKVESFKNFCIFNVAAGAVFLCDCFYHALKSVEKFEPVVVNIVIGVFIYWLVQIYILVCIHSLYRKFLQEKYPSLIGRYP